MYNYTTLRNLKYPAQNTSRLHIVQYSTDGIKTTNWTYLGTTFPFLCQQLFIDRYWCVIDVAMAVCHQEDIIEQFAHSTYLLYTVPSLLNCDI